MKRKLLTSLLFSILSLFYLADQGIAQKQTDLVWQQRAFPMEEFSLESPFDLSFSEYEIKGLARRYAGSIDGFYIFVFSDDLKTKEQFKFVCDFVSDDTKLKVELPSKAGQEVQVEFLDRFGFYNVVLTVRTERRIYTFQTVSKSKDNELAARFLSSIRFGGIAQDLSIESDDGKLSPSNVEIPQTQPQKQPASSPKPTTGSGIGAGNGPGNSTASPKPSPVTVGLKILSKPKAPYTDYARFYEIEGFLLLRVTFLANGKIGSVTPVSTLPFGLTESAIEAAKRVGFEPAFVNGVPMTTVKTFQYSFSLY